MKEKLFDKDGKELFEYNVEICCSSNKSITYIAESEEECKDIFLENNQDLDDDDIIVNKLNTQHKENTQ